LVCVKTISRVAAMFWRRIFSAARAVRDARRARAREMFARVTGFPTVKTLDGFDFGSATRRAREASKPRGDIFIGCDPLHI
jgi:hypothetical protein